MPPSSWDHSKLIARALLHDRRQRRRLLGQWLAVVVGWLAVGNWVIAGWLKESVWRFAGWWGICAVLTLGLMLFALYDAMAVIREERHRDDR